ncbi:Hypothetical protein mma_2530 [Janthinobacterium sp. Marseille]|nr:hypothetical protein [Janthinobacterium sp. Marseille]ABR91884.1 Hypothetical protein mma_2530 [Janthinobacterium sp. Marseille]
MMLINKDDNIFIGKSKAELDDFITSRKLLVGSAISFFNKEKEGIEKDGHQYCELKGQTSLLIFTLYISIDNALEYKGEDLFSENRCHHRKLARKMREQLDEVIALSDLKNYDCSSPKYYSFAEDVYAVQKIEKKKNKIGFY